MEDKGNELIVSKCLFHLEKKREGDKSANTQFWNLLVPCLMPLKPAKVMLRLLSPQIKYI